jgi:uncharacterized OB-fold protein
MTRPTVDRDSAPWWAALAEHRLTLQRCSHCATPRLVPRAMCNACGSFEWSWSEAAGTGTVATWTVSHRAFPPTRPTPFTVVMVRLTEARNILLPGAWSGAADGSDLAADLPVRAEFHDVAEPGDAPAALLSWTRASDQASACTGDVDT